MKMWTLYFVCGTLFLQAEATINCHSCVYLKTASSELTTALGSLQDDSCGDDQSGAASLNTCDSESHCFLAVADVTVHITGGSTDVPAYAIVRGCVDGSDTTCTLSSDNANVQTWISDALSSVDPAVTITASGGQTCSCNTDDCNLDPVSLPPICHECTLFKTTDSDLAEALSSVSDSDCETPSDTVGPVLCALDESCSVAKGHANMSANGTSADVMASVLIRGCRPTSDDDCPLLASADDNLSDVIENVIAETNVTLSSAMGVGCGCTADKCNDFNVTLEEICHSCVYVSTTDTDLQNALSFISQTSCESSPSSENSVMCAVEEFCIQATAAASFTAGSVTGDGTLVARGCYNDTGLACSSSDLPDGSTVLEVEEFITEIFDENNVSVSTLTLEMACSCDTDNCNSDDLSASQPTISCHDCIYVKTESQPLEALLSGISESGCQEVTDSIQSRECPVTKVCAQMKALGRFALPASVTTDAWMVSRGCVPSASTLDDCTSGNSDVADDEEILKDLLGEQLPDALSDVNILSGTACICDTDDCNDGVLYGSGFTVFHGSWILAGFLIILAIWE